MQKNNLTQDYLECILILQQSKGSVRSVDIVHKLGVTKPTVCSMVKKLQEKNYIVFGEDRFITLTETGREIAQKVYDKHLMLAGFLLKIGVSKDNALEEAGDIEHIIGEETYNCLEKLYNSNAFNTYALKLVK